MDLAREALMPTKDSKSTPRPNRPPEWARIGYRRDRNGNLVPLDHKAQAEFSRMIRDIASRRRGAPRPG